MEVFGRDGWDDPAMDVYPSQRRRFSPGLTATEVNRLDGHEPIAVFGFASNPVANRDGRPLK